MSRRAFIFTLFLIIQQLLLLASIHYPLLLCIGISHCLFKQNIGAQLVVRTIRLLVYRTMIDYVVGTAVEFDMKTFFPDRKLVVSMLMEVFLLTV